MPNLQGAPSPIQPKTSNPGDFDPNEVARQIALIEMDLFKAIDVNEIFYCHNWIEKPDKCPNIAIAREWTSNVSKWVTSTIVSEKKDDKRVKSVRKLLDIFIQLVENHCYSAVHAFIRGFNSPNVANITSLWSVCF